jgi:hypothetical protein
MHQTDLPSRSLPSTCAHRGLFTPRFLIPAGALAATLVALSFSCAGSDGADPDLPPGIVRGPQVALPSPTSMTVAWTTGEPALGAVEFGPDASYGSRVDGGAPTTDHVLEIAGLDPGAEYRYRVLLDDVPEDGDHAFRTSPADPSTPFRFAVFGDCGSGSANQRAIATQVAAWAPALVLIAGDVVYESGTPSEITARYFEPYAELIDGIPFLPSLGNHDFRTDRGQPLLDALVLPTNDEDGTERYYSFDHGNAHFAAVDSNTDLGPGSPQHAWLDADLSRSSATWKFVYFHHPPYSSSKHGSSLEIRRSLGPLLEERGVDVVFNGHDHDYERTLPLQAETVVGAAEDPDYTDPPGVIYVVTGAGGHTLYPSGRSAFTAFSRSVYHFVAVDISGPNLALKAVLADGSVLDAMTIAKTR